MAQDHLFTFRIKSGGNSKECLKWCNLATISIIRVGRIKPPYRHLFKVNSVAALMTRTSISLENETIIMENWLIEYTHELDGWGTLIWEGSEGMVTWCIDYPHKIMSQCCWYTGTGMQILISLTFIQWGRGARRLCQEAQEGLRSAIVCRSHIRTEPVMGALT